MKAFSKHKTVLIFSLTVFLLATFASCEIPIANAAQSASIELEQFRWNTFPLKVLVDMNQWSIPDYALAVHEAFDSWTRSIWNYTQSFNDTILPTVNFLFYISDVNSTSNCDVLVSFAQNEISPSSDAVGVTFARWDEVTHDPIAPIIINITTYSATANHLFVKSVAMHEFGHVLGLGHASNSMTTNGPELMYYASSKKEIVYPSTLDVYALTQLYRGQFGHTVQLPQSIIYKMLQEGQLPAPSLTQFWETFTKYLPFLTAAILALIIFLVLERVVRRKKPEENQPVTVSADESHS